MKTQSLLWHIHQEVHMLIAMLISADLNIEDSDTNTNTIANYAAGYSHVFRICLAQRIYFGIDNFCSLQEKRERSRQFMQHLNFILLK